MSIEKVKHLIKHKGWYIFLLLATSIFMVFNYKSIGSVKELDTVAIIFVVWIILWLYPLFSSIQIGHIKLSRKIDDMQKETKEAINDIKMQIMDVKVSNSNNNILMFGSLPPKEPLDELKATIKSDDDGEVAKKKYDIEVTEETIFLFESRLKLEQKIIALSSRYSYDGPKNMLQMVRFLERHEVLSRKQMNAIENILKICNRAVHGEKVADNYIEFVRDVLPIVIEQLGDAMLEEPAILVCEKCGYKGPSKYENYCPNCGNVICD